MDSNRKYDIIKNHPNHVSQRHPQLSKASYAARFSPFAALTGYDDIVNEAARSTDEKYDLDDDARLRLSNRLSVVFDHPDEEPEISITYFILIGSAGKYIYRDDAGRYVVPNHTDRGDHECISTYQTYEYIGVSRKFN